MDIIKEKEQELEKLYKKYSVCVYGIDKLEKEKSKLIFQINNISEEIEKMKDEVSYS